MVYTDQTGREVNIISVPQRIISVVPSQTELLYDLGLKDRIFGITKFCIHPDEMFRTKTRVGGTKQLHIDKIKELNPDLIIANKEENTKEQLEELMQFYPVWISDIKNLDDALTMIKSVGELTGTEKTANEILLNIQIKFRELDKAINQQPKATAAYLIWQKPYMVAGGDTFINDMMKRAGLINVFQNQNRYPETTREELNQLKPDIILLSSEPFPFKEKHRQEMEKSCTGSRVLPVDGEMFSWYGSRLLKAADYLKTFTQHYHKN
ncbi:MAG: ABC transporter substrate-binding protein [Bacteroidia bacterium]